MVIQITVNLNDECIKLIPYTTYLVEANSFEQLSLFVENKNRENWDSHCRVGGMQQVGILNNRPITVELQWQKINNLWVCFYHACSTVVDYDIINTWIDKTFSNIPKDNAMNYRASYR